MKMMKMKVMMMVQKSVWWADEQSDRCLRPCWVWRGGENAKERFGGRRKGLLYLRIISHQSLDHRSQSSASVHSIQGNQGGDRGMRASNRGMRPWSWNECLTALRWTSGFTNFRGMEASPPWLGSGDGERSRSVNGEKSERDDATDTIPRSLS